MSRAKILAFVVSDYEPIAEAPEALPGDIFLLYHTELGTKHRAILIAPLPPNFNVQRCAFRSFRFELTLTLENTIFLDNAFDFYEDVFNHKTLEMTKFTVYVRPTDQGITKIFGKLDPDWHWVRCSFYGYQYNDSTKWGVGFRFFPDGNNYDFEEGYAETLNDIREYYFDLLEERKSFYWYDKKGMTIHDTIPFYEYPNGWTLQYVANSDDEIPSYYVREFFGPVKTLEKALECVERYHPRSHRYISQTDKNWVVDILYKKNNKQKWMADARWRPHYLMLETTLSAAKILVDILPAYVLMWMLEYIPGMRRIPEIKRIGFIDKAYKSIRAIRTRRTIESENKHQKTL